MKFLETESQGKVRILLVDDHPGNLLALEAILSHPKYQLIQAQSGREALLQVLRHDFAVLLLDVMMPDIDGFELATLIKRREQSRRIPIIFLTAVAKDAEFYRKGYSVGAVDYLSKPLEPEVVKAKVAVFAELFEQRQTILRQARLLQESEERERQREVLQAKLAADLRYRNLADAVPDIVWTAGADGQIRYYNSKWYEYTGLGREEGEGWAGLEQALHPEERLGVCQSLKLALEGSQPFEQELRLRRQDGVYRWYLCRGCPERAAVPGICPGQPVPLLGWVGTCSDIDDQKRMVGALEEKGAELLKAVQARDEFLSIASHELKTPLTPIKIQCQSILRLADRSALGGLPLDKLVRMLRIVDRQVERLSKLVEELLDVSRIRAGRLELKLERFDLALLVEHAVARFREHLRASDDRACPLEIAALDHIEGKWDRFRAEQVVDNLIANAIKYGSGRSVRVSLRKVGDLARLTVQDFGPGISREDQRRIFDRFERAVSARNYGGLGLGLYIVREIVGAHHGSIQVDSEPGKGAVFTVDLPLGLERKAA